MKWGGPPGVIARQPSPFTYLLMFPEPGVTARPHHAGQKKSADRAVWPGSTRMPQLGLPIPFLIARFNDIIRHIPIPLIVII